MFRKIAIAVGAVLLGLVIVSYTSLPSLAHVKWNDTCAWLDSQVPVETQIKQLRLQVDKIDNEIRGNLGKLAKMEVETQNLEQNVVALKEEQGKRKSQIAALTNDLDDVNGNVRVKLSEKNAKTNQLDVLVGTYEVKSAKLKSLEGLLAAKRQTLEAAHEKIGAMKEQRDQLRVTIQKLETRVELVSIKTQQSQIQVSDDAINKCNALAKKIDDRLTEQEKYAENLAKYGYSDGPQTAEKNNGKSSKVVIEAAKKILAEDQDEK